MSQRTHRTFFLSGIIATLILLIVGGVAFAFGSNPNKATMSSAPGEHWAWNDITGWIDFPSSGIGQTFVGDLSLEGYASSGVGQVALDCSTAPGTNCTHVYYVHNNKGGRLSGWAWNDSIGWVGFCGTTDPAQA